MSSSPIPSPPPDASVSQRGLISTGTQSFAGVKTFSGTLNLNLLTLGGAAGSAGEVLTSAGAGLPPVWAAAGGGHAAVTLTAVGAAPNANGASLVVQALTLQPADGTNPGVLTAGAQSIGGAKNFSAQVTSAGGFASTYTGASVPGGTADFYLNHVANSAPALANFGGALELGGLNSFGAQADIYLGSMQNRASGYLVQFLNRYGNMGGAEHAVFSFAWDGDYSLDGNISAGANKSDARLQSVNGSLYTISANGPLIQWNLGAQDVVQWYTGGGSQVATLTAAGAFIGTKFKLSGLASGAVGFEASAANLGTARAFLFNNTVTLATGAAMLAEWQNNGTKMMGLTYYGRLEIEDIKYLTGGFRLYGGSGFSIENPGGGSTLNIHPATGVVTMAYGVNTDIISTYLAGPLTLTGADPDAAGAIGVLLNNTATLSTAGAKLVSIRNNGTEKAFFDKDGFLNTEFLVGRTDTSATIDLGGGGARSRFRYGNGYWGVDATGCTGSSDVANGAGAVGFLLNTRNTLSTAGAKLLSITNNGTEKVKVDRDGVISTVGHTHVRATTNTGSLTGGTPSTVVFGTEVTDNLSEYNNTTGVFTAAKDGLYLVSAMVQTDGGAALTANDNFQIYIYKNGTTIMALGAYSFAETNITGPMSSGVSTTLTLVAGDTLEIQAAANGYSPNLITQHYANYFTIDRLI